jgi:hypothetical protein
MTQANERHTAFPLNCHFKEPNDIFMIQHLQDLDFT